MGKLTRGLIVSCQACKGEPLYGYNVMHLFAIAAVAGGAVGIRALQSDIRAIKSAVGVPVIGLTKHIWDDSEIYITSTRDEVDSLLETQCEVITMDATSRFRHGGERLEDLVRYVREHAPDRELMADVADEDDVKNAVCLGFDYVSTTLRGYTEGTKGVRLPDIEFMRKTKQLLAGSQTKMIAEGGIFEAGEMKAIGEINPYAVVVGSAITRPKVITQRLSNALKETLPEQYL